MTRLLSTILSLYSTYMSLYICLFLSSSMSHVRVYTIDSHFSREKSRSNVEIIAQIL